MTEKLTTEEVKLLIAGLSGNRTLREEKYLAALEIALTVLEQQEMQEQIENDGWVEWGGGDCPVEADCDVEVKFRDGDSIKGEAAIFWEWHHHVNGGDIIAYRVIENDGREG